MRYVARPVAAVALLVLAVVLGFAAVMNVPGASADPGTTSEDASSSESPAPGDDSTSGDEGDGGQDDGSGNGGEDETTPPPTGEPTEKPTDDPSDGPTEDPSDKPTGSEPPADTAREVDDAVFRWGINRVSNAHSHKPNAYNFFSAGVANPGKAGSSVKKRHWSAKQGQVTIQKWMGGNQGWQTAQWNGWKRTHKGKPTGITGNFSMHNVVYHGGEGWVDQKKRRAEIQWKGTFTVVFYGGESVFTVTDPQLSVTGRTGKVTATLGGFGSERGATKWIPLNPVRTTIASLSKVTLGKKGLSLTPDYRGVTVDITDEFPGVDKQSTGKGKGSFPPEMVRFLGQVGTASYWYSSGSSGDKYKQPLPITVSYDSSDEVTNVPEDDDEDSVPDVDNSINDAPLNNASSEPQQAGPAPAAQASGLPAQVPEGQRELLVPADLGEVKLASAATADENDVLAWWLGGALLLLAAGLFVIPARAKP